MRYVRLILAGALLGAGLYFTPFFVMRFFFFGFLIFALFRLLAGPRWGWGWRGQHMAYAGGPFGPGMRGYGPMGFADKVRSMTDDEYKAFQERFNNGPHFGGRGGYGCRGGHRNMQGQPAPANPQNPERSTQTNA